MRHKQVYTLSRAMLVARNGYLEIRDTVIEILPEKHHGVYKLIKGYGPIPFRNLAKESGLCDDELAAILEDLKTFALVMQTYENSQEWVIQS